MMNDKNGNGIKRKRCACGCGGTVSGATGREYLPGHLAKSIADWHTFFSAPFCRGCGCYPKVDRTIILCADCFLKRDRVLAAKQKWFSEITDQSEVSKQTAPTTDAAPIPVPEPWKPSPDKPDEEDDDEPEWIPEDQDEGSKEDPDADAKKTA